MKYYSLKNTGNPIICDNMDEPRGYYVKWNKSTKRQITYTLTYMNSSYVGLGWDSGWGKGKYWISDTKLQFDRRNNFCILL
jgi:hypothetical protein